MCSSGNDTDAYMVGDCANRFESLMTFSPSKNIPIPSQKMYESGGLQQNGTFGGHSVPSNARWISKKGAMNFTRNTNSAGRCNAFKTRPSWTHPAPCTPVMLLLPALRWENTSSRWTMARTHCIVQKKTMTQIMPSACKAASSGRTGGCAMKAASARTSTAAAPACLLNGCGVRTWSMRRWGRDFHVPPPSLTNRRCPARPAATCPTTSPAGCKSARTCSQQDATPGICWQL
mmetsp:Transcript_28591/g.71899  ORF Transcript_28591/g.71899 Transcript_28591/m.71899 type:complete len:232 (+) Transcript_28591:274-969(+)